MKLNIDGREVEVDVPADVPLLWALREEAGVKGVKFGCGMALCGACTVHIDGQARRSCVIGAGQAVGKDIRTIESLAEGDTLHPVQQAWVENNVPQCGYCQAGQIMTTVALLRVNPNPTDEQIDAALSANLCRCGTYPRIRKAVHRAAELIKEKG